MRPVVGVPSTRSEPFATSVNPERPPAGDFSAGGRVFSGDEPVRLSILVPAYNEERTAAHVVSGLLAADFPCPVEVIAVDDGSTDETARRLADIDDPRLTVLRHPRNLGKGAALMSAVAVATGTHVLPFDADHEYSPTDIPRLLEPVLADRCDIVYGTRLFGVNTVYQSYRYALGNRLLTLAANVLFDSSVSDLHTCFKLVPLSLVRQLDLSETGFGLDTELTARLLRLGLRPFEVPISYHSRSHAQGKKIDWRDGVACLRILARVRVAPRPVVTAHRYPESVVDLPVRGGRHDKDVVRAVRVTG
ncbi:glycosyltransferase family 2 protein [Actinokineospora auranticolor]|nr:glycosyltransferase family 2 protein [Actinokineospora auranticolor]